MAENNRELRRYDLEWLRLARQEVTAADEGMRMIDDLAGEISLIIGQLPELSRHGADYFQDLRDAHTAFLRALHYYTTYLHLQATDFRFLGDIAAEMPDISGINTANED